MGCGGVFVAIENHSVPLLDSCFKIWYLLPSYSLRKRYSENFCYVPDKQNPRMVKVGNDLWRASSRFRWSSWVLISKGRDSIAFLAKRVTHSAPQNKKYVSFISILVRSFQKMSRHQNICNDIWFFNFFWFFFCFLSTLCWLMLWSFQFVYWKEGVHINFRYCTAHRIIKRGTCK